MKTQILNKINQKNISHLRKNRIRKIFLENPNYSIYEIAEIVKLSPSTVSEMFTNKSFSIVKSVTEANKYFLFTDLLEKEIITDNQNVILNIGFFSKQEKEFIKKFGLIIC